MIKLISVHIPKTGGSSFKKALAEVYGQRLAFDYGDEPGELQDAEVIHGHFPAGKYAYRFPEAKVIMWLRHPVDRVISYYYFWSRIKKHGNPHHDLFLEKKLSLMEFAEHDAFRNEFKGYLHNFDLNRFFFVGITERYDMDLSKLSKRLGTTLLKSRRENMAPAKHTVPENLRGQIARLHRYEMDVYRYFLERTI